MEEYQFIVPMSQERPDFTVFGSHRRSKPGLVLEALARLGSAKAVEVGQEAARIATLLKVPFREDASFSPQVTRNYLIMARKSGLVETETDQHGPNWRLSNKAKELISGTGPGGAGRILDIKKVHEDLYSRLRKTDDKGRMILPAKYAGQMFVLDEIADGVLVLRRATVELPPMPNLDCNNVNTLG